MGRSSYPRLTSLDCPALGLVMQIAALIALPTPLHLATTLITEDLAGAGLGALVLLQLIAVALQLAAGIAIARRSFARPLVVAYGVATLTVAAASVAAFAADEAPLALAAGALELIAGPLVILGAPLVFDLDRLADRRSPADVAAALCVLVVGSLLAMPVGLIDEVRMIAISHASPSVWLWLIPRYGLGLATAIVALRAVRSLLRPGPPAAAQRALTVYVVASIAVCFALGILPIIEVLAGDYRDHRGIVLAPAVVSLVVSVTKPLAIWAYARPALREPIAVERRALASPLVWSVLWTVPLLASRAPALGAMRQTLGSVLVAVIGALFCVQAVANVAAVRAALRDDGRAFCPAAVATAIAVALLGVVLVWLYALLGPASLGGDKPVWPLTVLIAMLGTLAWSQRRPPR